MKINKFNTNKLKMIDYEGAGNKTPVVDVSGFSDIPYEFPEKVKTFLEDNKKFRSWLKKTGEQKGADTVMIFYPGGNRNYDFIAFIGEPNADISVPFSEMCGNGIRSLALHVVLGEKDKKTLSRFVRKGIRILTSGTIRSIRISEIDFKIKKAEVIVDLGRFQSNPRLLNQYINFNRIKSVRNSQIKFSNSLFESINDRQFGIGFNGDKNGEPHLVLLNNEEEYFKIIEKFGLDAGLGSKIILKNLRFLASVFGNYFTFNKRIFPQGINFNIGFVWQGSIYMATHERSILSSKGICRYQQIMGGFCRCVTPACGTGGGVVVNIVKQFNYLKSKNFRTKHRGGDILYNASESSTIMTGPAKKSQSFSTNFYYNFK